MKTTETYAIDQESQKDKKLKLSGEIARPSKSLRPQKSMVRVKSLKPKRLTAIKGIKITKG